EKARSATIPTRMITSPLTNVIMRDAEQKSISSLILEWIRRCAKIYLQRYAIFIVHYSTVRFANTRPTPAHGATDPGAGATLGRFGLARGQWRKTAPAPCFCANLKQFESRG